MVTRTSDRIEQVLAWILGLLWLAPLAYAFVASVRPRAFATSFSLTDPWTLANFAEVWSAAPFERYFLNTILLVTGILAGQLIVGTLAAFAFARFRFPGREVAFWVVLLQLMLLPDVLIAENFRVIARLGLVDTLPGIGLPYLASGFFIFLLRQTFLSVPEELVEACQVEGVGRLRMLWRVFVPLGRPTLVAFGLVSVSNHWNNFLWPLVVTNSVESRPLTVGLAIFNSSESGVNWTLLSTATVIIIAPLLAVFLVFQRQFLQSFMRAGIR
jgi:sn-glycerol 3-phosphate transport system permease protein